MLALLLRKISAPERMRTTWRWYEQHPNINRMNCEFMQRLYNISRIVKEQSAAGAENVRVRFTQ